MERLFGREKYANDNLQDRTSRRSIVKERDDDAWTLFLLPLLTNQTIREGKHFLLSSLTNADFDPPTAIHSLFYTSTIDR